MHLLPYVKKKWQNIKYQKYECKKDITCKSNNLIYCITCRTCKQQYVGQTGDNIQKRFAGHIVSIRRRDLKEDVGRHFNLPNHRGIKDLEISVLDFIHLPAKTAPGLNIRLQIESTGYTDLGACSHLVSIPRTKLPWKLGAGIGNITEPIHALGQ